MMLGVYTDLRGIRTSMNLDAAVDVVGGVGVRSGWLSLVLYVPERSAFVELRDTPPDAHGHATTEAEQITEQYLTENFAVSAEQIRALKFAPASWKFIDRRKRRA